AVSASSAELVCFLAENLRYESACAHRAGVRLADGDDLRDVIGRNACSDSTVGSQCGGRGNHGIDSVIRILQRSQLSLQKDLFAFFESVPQEKRNIAHIGFYHFSVFLQFRHDLVRVQKRFVIEMLKKNILGLADTFHFFSQFILKEQFVYLETDLGIFIRLEGSDAGLGGSDRKSDG